MEKGTMSTTRTRTKKRKKGDKREYRSVADRTPVTYRFPEMLLLQASILAAQLGHSMTREFEEAMEARLTSRGLWPPPSSTASGE